MTLGLCAIVLFAVLLSAEGFVILPVKASKPHVVRRQMFSGIVEEIGVVHKVEEKEMELWDGTRARGVEMTVDMKNCSDGAYLGCSIAVNGVCLTATSILPYKVTFGIAPETIRRTNLGQLKQGSGVNLERALQVNSRNSGHFVQGHVDCTGEIIDKWNEGDSLWIKVKVPSEFMKYIVPKGFICIDGTSLTVCDVHSLSSDSHGWFTFMMIEHTQKHVIIPTKSKGEFVNLEVDVLAKMVEKSISAFTENFESRLRKLELSSTGNSN